MPREEASWFDVMLLVGKGRQTRKTDVTSTVDGWLGRQSLRGGGLRRILDLFWGCLCYNKTEKTTCKIGLAWWTAIHNKLGFFVVNIRKGGLICMYWRQEMHTHLMQGVSHVYWRNGRCVHRSWWMARTDSLPVDDGSRRIWFIWRLFVLQ